MPYLHCILGQAQCLVGSCIFVILYFYSLILVAVKKIDGLRVKIPDHFRNQNRSN